MSPALHPSLAETLWVGGSQAACGPQGETTGVRVLQYVVAGQKVFGDFALPRFSQFYVAHIFLDHRHTVLDGRLALEHNVV